MSDLIHQSRDGEAERAVAAPEAVRTLWLDLEDTIILPVVNGWFQTEPINIDKVKRFIAKFKPAHINIFSFAIWNEPSRELFNQGTRPMLEQALGVTFDLVLTVDDDVIPACCAVMKLNPSSVDFSEMSNFWSKQGAFRLCMQHMFKNSHTHGVAVEVALLDDAVFNEDFFWPDLNVRGCILNIDQMQ